MIDKQEYYHGAAMVRVLDDPRCREVRRHDIGYSVNGAALAFLKYSTKARSPWRFTFNAEEIRRLESGRDGTRVVVGLVCGGDGICSVTWEEATSLLGSRAGWISVQRGFHERYAVAGPAEELARKIPRGRWPGIVFGGNEGDGNED